MMKLPIDRLRGSPESQFNFHGTQEELGLQGLGFPISETDIGLRLFEADSGYFMAGHLSGIAWLECHRCAEQFEHILEIELEALLTFEKREEFENEANVIEVSPHDREIDITKFVSDSILLSLPVKILCDENCNGLCAQCGTNLNHGNCDCEQETIDPRWNKLKELNLDQEGE